jgi:hypothetical protein
MSATIYKDFRIEPFQTTSGGWRAKITRLDGQKIKVAVPAGNEHDSITTGGMESLSAEAAIDEAKRLIDCGGMS